MIGYKATYNNKCISITYEIGKTYTFHGKLQICKQGFHFCENLPDVFEYYNIDNSKLKVFEIEILGNVIELCNLSVTNKLKVIRKISLDDWQKFDTNNNLVYYKELCGKEHWQKFDTNNNLVYYRNSNGEEYWQEFDKHNNLIYYKNFNGKEYWKKYNNDNNCIYYKDKYQRWSITIK